MQTNGVNGGHQHEASEKRVNRGTFTPRLDMELCACGAKRWVDQDGNVATQWQFINLRATPGGNEGAGAAPRTPPKSALDGLITCGSCGKPMLLDDTRGDQEACYACQSRCPTPRLHAHRAEELVIGKVLQTVLTDEKISRVLEVVNDPGRYDEAREHRLTRQDVQELMENSERLVLAVGRTVESREFLGRFIAGIRIHAEKAVICYALPLPEDSPLAGMRRQEIDLPEGVLAR